MQGENTLRKKTSSDHAEKVELHHVRMRGALKVPIALRYDASLSNYSQGRANQREPKAKRAQRKRNDDHKSNE